MSKPGNYKITHSPRTMSAPITTAFGEAVPPAPRHSVTVHMGGWDTVEKYGADSSAVIPHFKNAYPRMKPHRDIVKVRSSPLLDATPSLISLFTDRHRPLCQTLCSLLTQS